MPNYQAVATGKTPLLVIYLIDVSASMSETINDAAGETKLTLVSKALQGIMKVMMRRSMKGEAISARYGISLLAYSTGVTDVYGGTLNIEEALKKGLPHLTADYLTNTSAAFEQAYRILIDQLPHLQGCPAPMVCHLTDGGYNAGDDPRPIVERIKSLSNDDGNVLVENIYVGDQLTKNAIGDVHQWQGVIDPSDLADSYVQALYEMSSPLPDSYADELKVQGYSMQPGVPMLIPADRPELVQLAFAMSGATKTG